MTSYARASLMFYIVIQYVLALTFYKIGYNKPPCFKAALFYDVSSAKRNT